MRILTAGINFQNPGSGGAKCLAYLSAGQRALETLVFSLLAGVEVLLFCRRAFRAQYGRPNFDAYKGCRGLRTVMVTVLALTFGFEMVFKVRSESMLFILNPCHVATILQLICLLGDQIPLGVLHLFFATHMYLLSGATLAMIFPVLNTRQLPGEVWVYWIQHVLIIAYPVYLFSLGGVFCSNAFLDPDVYFLCHGVLILYNFGPLQLLSVLTHVNLNNVLCPAISDPFAGQMYRVAAVIHQSAFLPLHGKLHVYVARKVLGCFRLWPPPVDGRPAIGHQQGLMNRNRPPAACSRL